jgi:hypothetical protein
LLIFVYEQLKLIANKVFCSKIDKASCQQIEAQTDLENRMRLGKGAGRSRPIIVAHILRTRKKRRHFGRRVIGEKKSFAVAVKATTSTKMLANYQLARSSRQSALFFGLEQQLGRV